MEFHPLNFGLLCMMLFAMGCFWEGGCALGVGGHSGMPSILRKNRLRGSFLEKLKRSRHTNSHVSSLSMTSYEAYNYTQVLDHFAYTPESYQTFPQRYFIEKSNWGGAQNNSPIFVWLGEEQEITNDLGLLMDQAPIFKALLVYIEHRYYGTSMPFGGEEAAYANASTMGYFTSTQALADYATVIVHLKKILNAKNCPVVVIGGSYGGMLAAWFRLKYPHLTIGALASSAPILYFDDITPTYGYGSVVTKDFRDASDFCYRRINESWDMMDKIASSPQGFVNLSKLFNTCENITDKGALYDFLELTYDGAAQYNFEEVKGICNVIDSLPGEADTVSRIAAAANYTNEGQCLDLGPFNYTYSGWDWQTCTEMVFPISNPPGTTMLPPSVFDIKSYSRECYVQFGALPRQHWATTEFGGHDIKRVLKDFGSNIIFSNGLRDPWSSAGVLGNIAESIEEGTHCEDIVPSTSDDPVWLKEQRLKELNIIQKWINEYKS